jgi:hypothetical protein
MRKGPDSPHCCEGTGEGELEVAFTTEDVVAGTAVTVTVITDTGEAEVAVADVEGVTKLLVS